MKPERWLETAAAPLASLFVLLVLVLSALDQPPEAYGVRMEVPQLGAIDEAQMLRANDPCNYSDDRALLIHLDALGHADLNETPIPDDELGARLTRIFEPRSFKIIYLVVDPALPYERFVRLYTKIAAASPGLRVPLMTPAVPEASERWSLKSSPVLVWRQGSGQKLCARCLLFLHPGRCGLFPLPTDGKFLPRC